MQTHSGLECYRQFLFLPFVTLHKWLFTVTYLNTQSFTFSLSLFHTHAHTQFTNDQSHFLLLLLNITSSRELLPIVSSLCPVRFLSPSFHSSTSLLCICVSGSMAFRKALKHTAIIGSGAVATIFGLSQLSEYRKTQVGYVPS